MKEQIQREQTLKEIIDFKPFKAWRCDDKGIPTLVDVDYLCSITRIYFKNPSDAIDNYLYDFYVANEGKSNFNQLLNDYLDKVKEWRKY